MKKNTYGYLGDLYKRCKWGRVLNATDMVIGNRSVLANILKLVFGWSDSKIASYYLKMDNAAKEKRAIESPWLFEE